jgi:hypothetical protein
LPNATAGDSVGTQKVAHVEQQPKVVVSHATHQLLDAVGILYQKTMIFDHGLDAVASGVLAHSATGGDEGGQGIGEAFASRSGREAKGGVVAHTRGTEGYGDVYFPFDSGDFLGGIATTPGQKICADGEIAHADADVAAVRFELVGIG